MKEKTVVHRMIMETPIGKICIEENGEALTGLYMAGDLDEIPESIHGGGVLEQTRRELEEYFRGERREFTVPIHEQGTEFQKNVWKALRRIPYGETRCYEEVAQMAGSPGACRAVGGANHKNPIMIITPCHRVIGKDGSLTGFGGGLNVKQYLLDLENGR